jgi:mono/diheme cytochrome c family protein
LWHVNYNDGDAAGPRLGRLALPRGAYLALAGNCAGCHTARGGAPFAGGRGIETPFGTVYAGNLTPDPRSGLGGWTRADFWRALHHGRSRDGRLLVPVFPIPPRC